MRPDDSGLAGSDPCLLQGLGQPALAPVQGNSHICEGKQDRLSANQAEKGYRTIALSALALGHPASATVTQETFAV